MTYKLVAHMTEEELAALIDVNRAPPELRRQAEATLAFLVDITFKNPISADSKEDYLVAFGMRAREFHLDAASWRKAQEVLADNRAIQSISAAKAHADWQVRRDRLKRENPKRTKTKIAELIHDELVGENKDDPDYKAPSLKTIQNNI